MARTQSKVLTAAEGKAMKKTLATEAASHAKALKDLDKLKKASKDTQDAAIKTADKTLAAAQKDHDAAVAAAGKVLTAATKAHSQAIKDAAKAFQADEKVHAKAASEILKASEKTNASLGALNVAAAANVGVATTETAPA